MTRHGPIESSLGQAHLLLNEAVDALNAVQGGNWFDAGDSELQLSDTAGHTLSYGMAHYLGLNDLVVRERTSGVDLAVRADIRADPRLLSGVMVDRSTGTPEIASRPWPPP